jgi:signal transduction histidine kinase
MLSTVMAQPKTDAVSRSIVWRQLVDVLAQHHGQHHPNERHNALVWLTKMRNEIAPSVRASTARSLAERIATPDLVAYFAKDDPSIAAPILARARLTADQWREILPMLPSSSRALLRERRNLPDGIATALRSFGNADYALEAPARAAQTSPAAHIESDAPGQTPITEIVARIEAFKARKSAQALAETDVAASPKLDSAQFHFETNVEGEIVYVAPIPREAICGMTIATASEGWLCGVDGHAAGAFRAHSAFRSARLRVAGKGPTAGDWVIDGVPVFDQHSGKFLGYRGTGRRPMQHERAESHDEAIEPNTDSLRQLVHELRTPLNAIQGFAEMIERQMLGPVSETYRARARRIMYEGGRLLTAIEDVDTAARLQSHALGVDLAKTTDAAALLTLIGRECAQLTDLRHVHLRITRSANELLVCAEKSALHRLFSRLLGAMLGIAEAGEVLTAALTHTASHVYFAISRPQAIIGREEHELLDPGYGPDGDWPDAPLLGLGFGLRLIANLATAINVKFGIEDQRFVLILPAAHDSDAQHIRTPAHHADERLSTRPPAAD